MPPLSTISSSARMPSRLRMVNTVRPARTCMLSPISVNGAWSRLLAHTSMPHTGSSSVGAPKSSRDRVGSSCGFLMRIRSLSRGGTYLIMSKTPQEPSARAKNVHHPERSPCTATSLTLPRPPRILASRTSLSSTSRKLIKLFAFVLSHEREIGEVRLLDNDAKCARVERARYCLPLPDRAIFKGGTYHIAICTVFKAGVFHQNKGIWKVYGSHKLPLIVYKRTHQYVHRVIGPYFVMAFVQLAHD